MARHSSNMHLAARGVEVFSQRSAGCDEIPSHRKARVAWEAQMGSRRFSNLPPPLLPFALLLSSSPFYDQTILRRAYR